MFFNGVRLVEKNHQTNSFNQLWSLSDVHIKKEALKQRVKEIIAVIVKGSPGLLGLLGAVLINSLKFPEDF